MGLLSPGPMGSRLKMSDSEGLEYFRRVRDGIPESSCTESRKLLMRMYHMQRFLCVYILIRELSTTPLSQGEAATRP